MPSREIELEVRVAARGLDDLRDRLLRERRAPEVRVHDHARRVEHAAQARRAHCHQLCSQPLGKVAGIGAGTDLLARTVEHGPRGVDRERVVQAARELVHRWQVAQLHDRKATSSAVGPCGPAPSGKSVR